MKKKGIILGLAGVVLIGGVGLSLLKRVDKLETTKTVGSYFTYELGKLNDATGRGYKKNQIEDVDDYYEWMHLNQYINAEGLKCELAEDAKIVYQINFYDEDYQFISVLNKDEDYDSAETPIPEGAKFAIIEISPIADPDGEIQSQEITKYAKMLTVTYNKDSK